MEYSSFSSDTNKILPNEAPNFLSTSPFKFETTGSGLATRGGKGKKNRKSKMKKSMKRKLRRTKKRNGKGKM